MRTSDAQMVTIMQNQGAPGFDHGRLEELVEVVPEPMRLQHYTRSSIPAEFFGSFGYYHDKIGDIHLDGLPEPMQKEMMFAIWRIVELGGRVPCASLGLLTRELAATGKSVV